MPMGDMSFSINWFEVFAVLSLIAGIPILLPAAASVISSVVLHRRWSWSCALTGGGIGILSLTANILWLLLAVAADSQALFLAASSATVLFSIVVACFIAAKQPDATDAVELENRSSYGRGTRPPVV